MNTQLKIMLLKGAPSSGKSSFCQELMRKEPGVWKRINNDALRQAIDLNVYSTENEKLIHSLRNHMLKEFLRKGYSVVIDNVNAGSRHFKEICEIVSKMNIDAQVFEKHFFVPLEELLERDSKRVGDAQVGEDIVKKFFGKLGGNQFKFYKPQHEVFSKRTIKADAPFNKAIQNEDAPKAIIVDMDGTYALIGDRSPYDASKAHEIDFPNHSVVKTVELYSNAGYKIIFCSGREDKDRETTMMFIERHSPNMEYQLFMRNTGDSRPDDIVKEEIYRNEIERKYNIHCVFDDRLKVCRMWHRIGLNLMRIGDPDADF
jgi:predicted kinase